MYLLGANKSQRSDAKNGTNDNVLHRKTKRETFPLSNHIAGWQFLSNTLPEPVSQKD